MRAHRHWIVTLVVASIFVVVVSAFPARAAAPVESKDGWEFDIVPYLWGAGLEGNVQIGRVPATSVQASFSDVWDYLNIGGMVAFEARKGNWGVLIDGIYIDLEDSMPTPDPAFGGVNASMTQQLYSGLITYRMCNARNTTVDFGFGTRYYDIATDLELTPGLAPGRSASASVDWWDWLVGVRVVGHPSKRWSLSGYADIGGGGSQMTWEAVAGADFAFNKTVSLAFGYRYLSIDYDENRFLYDVSMQGPYLGLGFHF